MADAAGDTRLRVFFALWPDKHTRAELHARGLVLCQRHGGRAVARDNLHLTLAFLGEQSPARVEELLQLAAQVKGHAFTLNLDRAGHWRHARMLWCAPRSTPAALVALKADLDAALQARGFGIEARPYVPHVTLVRKPEAVADVVTWSKPLQWRVQDFSLAVSELRAQGACYRLIGNWPLQRP